mmetsp:Transcript_69648/g.96843  ORF Transcript_69648/g.96843 Transcript_69648/m.96843 type:complete len:202 (-) Transcript_69648:160-765(-)
MLSTRAALHLTSDRTWSMQRGRQFFVCLVSSVSRGFPCSSTQPKVGGQSAYWSTSFNFSFACSKKLWRESESLLRLKSPQKIRWSQPFENSSNRRRASSSCFRPVGFTLALPCETCFERCMPVRTTSSPAVVCTLITAIFLFFGPSSSTMRAPRCTALHSNHDWREKVKSSLLLMLYFERITRPAAAKKAGNCGHFPLEAK